MFFYNILRFSHFPSFLRKIICIFLNWLRLSAQLDGKYCPPPFWNISRLIFDTHFQVVFLKNKWPISKQRVIKSMWSSFCHRTLAYCMCVSAIGLVHWFWLAAWTIRHPLLNSSNERGSLIHYAEFSEEISAFAFHLQELKFCYREYWFNSAIHLLSKFTTLSV